MFDFVLFPVECFALETVGQIVQCQVPKRIVARVHNGGFGQLARGIDRHGKFGTDMRKQPYTPPEILLKPQSHRHFEHISQLPFFPFFDVGVVVVGVAKFVVQPLPHLRFGECGGCAVVAHTHPDANAHVGQKIVGVAHIGGKRREFRRNRAARQVVVQFAHANAAAHLQVRSFLRSKLHGID